MPFSRPTLNDLEARKRADLESAIVGADARLRRNILFALARAASAEAHGLHGYLNYIAGQIVPDLAEVEFLDRFSNWWGIPRKAAAPAKGNVDFTGTDGSVITAGSVMQDSAARQYNVDSIATITAGSASVAVTAVLPGQAGNQSAGVSLTLSTPIPGVNSVGVVATGDLIGGADIEADSALQIRLRERVQTPPHGGALHDYVTWAKQVAGVTRAWAFSNYFGIGTVAMYFVRDNDASLIPDAAEVQTVQDYIDPLRPAGMSSFSAIAPTEVVQAITVDIKPNTVVVQTAIQAELADLFLRESQVDDGAGSGDILISQIRESVSIAAGETDNAVVSPTANLTISQGQISTLSTITFGTL